MAKNDFLARQRNLINTYVQATCDTYTQYMADLAIVTLHEKFGFGEKRCMEFWNALQENTLLYDDALGSRTKAQALSGETEYLRAKMDEKLKAALGTSYQNDFEQRYPNMEKVRY